MTVDTGDLAKKAARLRELHHQGTPLLLANCWDVATAKLTEELGFQAAATSSHAVADAFGLADTDSMPADVAFGLVQRVASAVSLPVTADLEAGYQLDPEAFVHQLLEAGAVGCNLEDGDHHGGGVLVDADRQAKRLGDIKAAARKAGVDIVINARVDVYARRIGEPDVQLKEGLRRGRLYLDAGADCIYPIILSDEKAIGEWVQGLSAPINVMMRPGGPSTARLKELGVARVSLASGLFRAAMNGARQAAQAFLDGTLYATPG